MVWAINSLIAATSGDVANPTGMGVAATAAACGVSSWVTALVVFARCATMLVSAWICWVN